MVGVTELHHPGVEGTVTAVNARQAEALRRTGWRPVQPSAPVDTSDQDDEHRTPEES